MSLFFFIDLATVRVTFYLISFCLVSCADLLLIHSARLSSLKIQRAREINHSGSENSLIRHRSCEIITADIFSTKDIETIEICRKRRCTEFTR